MSRITITFEQFLNDIQPDLHGFVQDLHDFLTENSCRASFEVKKTGLFGGYKHTKTKKSVANILCKKHALLVRIYGSHTSGYSDFLGTLPDEMVESIRKASPCKKLIDKSCKLVCTGYDFTIGGEHFQKCIYNCFAFEVTKESKSFIQAFVEHEIKEISNRSVAL